jgi:poly(A) polymerase Pap1
MVNEKRCVALMTFSFASHTQMPSYLGVTPPIAVSESTEREKEVTQTLMEELRRQNSFEAEDESRKR